MERMVIYVYPDKIGLYEQHGETWDKIDERTTSLPVGGVVSIPAEWGDIRTLRFGYELEPHRLVAAGSPFALTA